MSAASLKKVDVNNHSILIFLAQLFEKSIGDKLNVGFAEIMKTDTNSFTISSIDNDAFVQSLNREGLVDEIVIKTVEERA